jgi:hypothetical protein
MSLLKNLFHEIKALTTENAKQAEMIKQLRVGNKALYDRNISLTERLWRADNYSNYMSKISDNPPK